MTQEQLLKKLKTPSGRVDVVLDTDAFNEIDDQYAIAYLLRSDDMLNTKMIYAAPFFNKHSTSPEDGMEKSYDEIIKIIGLCGRSDLKDKVLKGSRNYLPDEHTPVISPAAEDLAKRAMKYTEENPLYVVAIGAITNVASALLINPEIKNRIVLIWLGGHAWHIERGASEFNMMQDIAGARVVFGCGVPLVQLPCDGVVSSFYTTKPELNHWLVGKCPIANYLACNTINEVENVPGYVEKAWRKVIWDVTAVAWLLNDNGKFMRSEIRHACVPQYDKHYSFPNSTHPITYVTAIHSVALMTDLFKKLTK